MSLMTNTPHPLSLRDNISDQVADWLHARLGRNANLCADSRRVAAGDGFIARTGKTNAVKDHIKEAIARGAAAVVLEADDPSAVLEPISTEVPMIRVGNLGARVGMIASAFYGRPSMTMQLIAVTGTNGKSTVTTCVAHLLARCGIAAAAIGTLGVGIFPAYCSVNFSPAWDEQLTVGLTTPDAVDLQRLLRDLHARDIRVVALEASSIGLEQGRLQGCAIKVAAFTNLSHDHLDFHQTMARYAKAKSLLFEATSLGAIVINMQDAYAPVMWNAADPRVERIAVGTAQTEIPVNAHSSLCVTRAEMQSSGWQLTLEGLGRAKELTGLVHLPVYGGHNIDNAMLVAGILVAMRIDAVEIQTRISELVLPPGRMQMVCRDAGPWVCIDYAHSPDALQRILEALRPVAQSRGGELLCIFGCGGDRDSTKRPKMGEIAARHADRIMLTSDNPRFESPEAILDAIESGIPQSLRNKVSRDSDRARAISQIVLNSQALDLILIAGKGHEQTQTIGDQKIIFSDADHALNAIDKWLTAHFQLSAAGVVHA